MFPGFIEDSDSDSDSESNSDRLILSYILGWQGGARQGVGASFRLEPVNQGVGASFQLVLVKLGGCILLLVGTHKSNECNLGLI